ncbi:MAG TPA: homoserine O-acetyltransferase [Chryseosolibacter sp.]|nr:homoserine O-acetyltransferase [Chryseosolibacter sp.]
MEKSENTFHFNKTFNLESGDSLPGFQLKYVTTGRLNVERNNVIWVCHALTGNADFTEWWPKLFKSGGLFDPSENFIICANMLGGCYGSTGPLSINPVTNVPYFHDFPTITNRDIVNAFDLLRQSLNIEKVKILIGGSLGGQQVLEWAISKPEVFDCIIPIACNAQHSAWGIAFNEAQRMAIEADSTWPENDPRAGVSGLKAARAIGMLSYRHYDSFVKTQSEKNNQRTDDLRASTYQRYQGDKLANRFNAFTYYRFSKAMDSHNIGRNRGSVEEALNAITADTLVIGINTDVLFPLVEQEYLAKNISNASLAVIDSTYGHDGFLVEFDQLHEIIKQFLNKVENNITV